MSVAGVARRTINTLVFLDILIGLVTLGLRLAVTHVTSIRTSFALIIVDIFVVAARNLIAIAGSASETINAFVIFDIFISVTLGLRLAITLVTSRTLLAVIIFDVSGHVARALRLSFSGPARWTILACSASLRVFACASGVASTVV